MGSAAAGPKLLRAMSVNSAPVSAWRQSSGRAVLIRSESPLSAGAAEARDDPAPSIRWPYSCHFRSLYSVESCGGGRAPRRLIAVVREGARTLRRVHREATPEILGEGNAAPKAAEGFVKKETGQVAQSIESHEKTDVRARTLGRRLFSRIGIIRSGGCTPGLTMARKLRNGETGAALSRRGKGNHGKGDKSMHENSIISA